MSQAERIVVVGAGLAGLRAAERLRELGFTGELVIIGAESLPPYHRPALSKQLLSGAMRPGDLTLPAYQEIGAKWRLGTSARWLSPRNRVLHLPGNEELTYDGLIIATGVEAVRPNNVPYHDRRIMVMRTLPDALALERAIAANRGPIAVVGGGFTGCEIAASLRHMGREVTLIGRSQSLLGSVLGPKLGNWLTGLHRDHGVDLALGTSVVDWQPNPDGIGLYLSDATSLLAACVVIATGTTPSTGWLRGSGLPLDNGVVCDPTCHVVGAEDIVAAGDVAQWPNLRFDSVPRRIEHWLNAVEMGRAAAESLMAGRATAKPFTPMPRFWTEQYGVRLQAAGVPKLGTDTITLGTPDDGTGTVVGYIRDGKLMGVVGVDCPSSVLTWTETIRTQNPAYSDPTPAPTPETGPRHSLPPKPKRTRTKTPTATRLPIPTTRPAPTDSNPRLRPAELDARFGPAASSSRLHPAEASGRFNPAASSSRLRPAEPEARFGPAASNPRLRPVEPDARFGPAASSSRLRPAEPEARFDPGASNSRLRPAEASGRFGPAASNSRLRPAEPNGHTVPTNGFHGPPGSSARLRPAEPDARFGPAASSSRMRPAEPNGHAVPTNGFHGPAESNPRLRPAEPDARFGPASSSRMRPAEASGRFDPAASSSRLRPAAPNGQAVPTNGFHGPAESSARLRPAGTNGHTNGFHGPAGASGGRHPGEAGGRNGSAGSGSNGHAGPVNGSSARLRSGENGSAGSASNGHAGPTSNGRSRNGKVNGRAVGEEPGLVVPELRAMDIYGRFGSAEVTGVIEPVTGWIPRVDARRPRG